MTPENTVNQEFANATLEQFGMPSGACGQILSQNTNIEQANAALAKATNSSAKVVAVQDDFKVEGLEAYAPFRRRPKGTMSTQVIRSFAAYTEKHQGEGTTVFVDADHLRATAVLDFGDASNPGHCDNLCSLTLRTTAAYDALLHATTRKLSQRDFAEWIENWAPQISMGSKADEMPLHKALAAVRNITIESAASAQHKEESLSSSRSAFESVKAKSDEAIPTALLFSCRPAPELTERTYITRISVITSEAKPLFQLNIIALETHREEAAEEMSGLIRQQIPEAIPVLMGSYCKR
ncbi:uncharacterized protein YfdQ (DUF2303 family) [Comamonas odontotermitis]|uniref:Uncharacterized protein YfdQ (DUF2303 family) n=1 Tax=Comamonas odontotermitis TaxID=379895 RepID=A0ABR6RGZ7_9BURK|nr:DUF2303 family protein [Comamonas odontotermitis]MBB6578441.1 uncharacterized protein YfdQ (DUF2303 family) [Comamonas odontotermitis]